MGTTTEELKKLYAKLGGADPNIPKASTPGEVLNGINELELGGDKLPEVTDADDGKALGVKQGKWDKMDVDIELPVVTTDDNGKVLMVSEGNWGKSDLPNSGLPEVTAEDNGDILKVVEGAWAKASENNDIVILDGKFVGGNIALIDATISQVSSLIDAGKIVLIRISKQFYIVSSASGDYRAAFAFNKSGGDIRLEYYNYSNSYSAYVLESRITIPYTSTNDTGKVMTVDQYGKWSKATIPSQLPAVTASDDGKILKVVNGVWTAVDPNA